mgnify:CR=1 FL=1
MTKTNNTKIGTPETHNLKDLQLFHNNPRTGDTEAIADSIRANGVYKPVVVNKGTHTGRPLEVLAGNHTVKAHQLLVEEGHEEYTTIDCWVIDVTEEQANRIVLADNRTADLGSYDNTALLDLLTSIDHDLDGTGYDYEDLDDLQIMLEETNTPDPTLQQPTAPYDEPMQDNEPRFNKEDGIGESTIGSKSLSNYENQPTRKMLFTYPINQFIWVQEALHELHEKHPEHGGSHAQLVLSLIEQAHGEKAPEATVEEKEQ